MMPPAAHVAPSRKASSKNHDKMLSPVVSKFKPLPSIPSSELLKQKSRPKLRRSKSQEVISKSKTQILSMKGGETVPTLSPIRLSHGHSSSTSKLANPYMGTILPAQPRRYSFGVSKSLPPSGGNGSRRGSDDFNNNSRYPRPNNQNHATVVLPQLLVKPSLEASDLKGNIRVGNNAFLSSANLDVNPKSIKKSKSTSSFDLENQQRKSIGNKLKPKRANAGGSLLSMGGVSDFGFPVTRTKHSKSTEYLPSVARNFNKVNPNSFMAHINENENLRSTAAVGATAAPSLKNAAEFTSPWADEPVATFQSTFTPLPIPEHKIRSISLQNSPRTMLNGSHDDAKLLKGSHAQVKSAVASSKDKLTNLTTNRDPVPTSINAADLEEPIMEAKSVNLGHKRSFNCKKTKPKLMRNRTFDVIETKMQNLPVIDLEVDE